MYLILLWLNQLLCRILSATQLFAKQALVEMARFCFVSVMMEQSGDGIKSSLNNSQIDSYKLYQIVCNVFYALLFFFPVELC